MTTGLDRFQRVLQYFWDPEPKNTDTMNSIWCLGQEYPSIPTPSVHSTSAPATPPGNSTPTGEDHSSELSQSVLITNNHGTEDNWPIAFLDDFDSRIWMTYRTEFPPIPRSAQPSNLSFTTRLRTQLSTDQSGFSSDVGWGCMIRTGQCLLANALQMLRLGRGWRRGKSEDKEKEILALFADDPRAPFSIHKFVVHGEKACGKRPGEWFGPSAAARCIQQLCEDHPEAGLRVYMNGDGSDVYEDAFRKVAVSADGVFHPTIILLGIRLGIDRVTPVYWEALKALLQMRQSVGIAGGRTGASHYFVGVQGNYVFYLDPHQPRPILPYRQKPSDYTQIDVDSCHTRRLRRLHLREMDPSMLLGFLIRNEDDWREFRRRVAEVQGKPVIHVSDVEPSAYGGAMGEREEAVDEVEVLDDDSDEMC
ncbi:putative cysteine protease atg4 [Kalaharituber pfeilii]|nr:putative cysteine protease atg4 [Kalaharituber pfeilii]